MMSFLRAYRTVVFCGLMLTTSVSFAAHDAPQKKELPDGKGFYILGLPKNHDPKKSYDLIVALHGAGGTAENFAAFWLSLLGNRETILAVPEGSVNAGQGFTWSSEDDARIVAAVEECIKTYGVDRKRVMLTGFSAGSGLGFIVIANHPDMFVCYGAAAKGVDGRMNKKELEKAVPNTSIYYAVGKQDPNHQVYKDNVDLLTKMKFNLVTEDPDIPHTITPDEGRKMLELFDSTSDKAGQTHLAEGKKQLSAKNWASAEKELTSAASGKGVAATEAATLLDGMKKEFAAKLDAAKALKGPDAVDALQKIEREYPGTSVAVDAKVLADKISADPATKEINATRQHEALEAKALQAMKDAQALEAASKWSQAVEAYERVAQDFAESSLKAKALESAERLKKDPRLLAAKNSGEAEKMLKRANNYLSNGANDEAKAILTELIQKFPDTDAAKQAKLKVSALK